MSLFEYVSPQTLDEAIGALAGHPQAMPLAGGHTVLLPANRRNITGALLVDLRRIRTLAGVEKLSAGGLKVGATTTIAALAEDKTVREQIPVLAEAALSIGDAQVRNRATIAGNIAASDAGADLPPVLLALNARIEVRSQTGVREIAADEFFAGGSAAIRGGELIVSVIFPASAKGSGLAYEKMKHPATLFALCGAAAAVRVGPGGVLEDVRVAVTGATSRPVRLDGVEKALLGKTGNEESVVSAVRASDNKLSFVNDLFGSAEYRGHLTRVLTERALKQAIATAAA